MSREFELRKEITLDATPEQVREAIATGPGIDGWFMGRNQVEPREEGRLRSFEGSVAVGHHRYGDDVDQRAAERAWQARLGRLFPPGPNDQEASRPTATPPTSTGPLTIQNWTDDTVALLRHLGVGRADLFGYSSGSAVAMPIALDHPEVVGKPVLASASYRVEMFRLLGAG